jgi:hypothetical protein
MAASRPGLVLYVVKDDDVTPPKDSLTHAYAFVHA